MQKFLIFLLMPLATFLMVAGCTLTVTNVQNQGKATDVVDSTSTASPDVKADIQVPINTPSLLKK